MQQPPTRNGLFSVFRLLYTWNISLGSTHINYIIVFIGRGRVAWVFCLSSNSRATRLSHLPLLVLPTGTRRVSHPSQIVDRIALRREPRDYRVPVVDAVCSGMRWRANVSHVSPRGEARIGCRGRAQRVSQSCGSGSRSGSRSGSGSGSGSVNARRTTRQWSVSTRATRQPAR